MHPFIYNLPFKIILTCFLAAWLGYCACTVFAKERIPAKLRLSSNQLVTVSVVLFVLIRWLYSLSTPPNDMDMSTWMASALTVSQSPTPFWTLLNYSDGRPLTVLPLVLVEWVGMALNFRVAEMTGVLIWAVSFWLMRKMLSDIGKLVLIGCMIWLGSIWMSSLAAYNSETIGIFFIVVALKYITQHATTKSSSSIHPLSTIYYLLLTYLLGLWLGCFPFVKLQLAPMGVVLGLWLFAQLISIKKSHRLLVTSTIMLFMGTLTPLMIVLAYYQWHSALPLFWGDYVNNYFVYSFTDEFSKNEVAQRFSIQNVYTFLTKTNQGLLFWSTMTLAGIVAIGCGVAQWRKGGHQLLWPMLLWLATLYAVLQAGNHFVHYLLLLLAPTIWLIDGCWGEFPKVKWLAMVAFGIISVQILTNTYARYPIKPFLNMQTVKAVAAEVRRLTQPHHKVVLWGYLDDVYTLARRPMGYRSPYTFWVYFPSSQRQFRIDEFLGDLRQNQPALFVDIFRKDLMDGYFTEGEWQRFPAIKEYIEAHYALRSEVEGVKFYVKNK